MASYEDAKEELDQLEAKFNKLKAEQQDITDRMDKLEGSRQKLLKRCRALSDKITTNKLRLHATDPSYCHHKKDFVEIELVEIKNKAGVITCSYMKCPHYRCTWWGSIEWFKQERSISD